MRHIKQNVTRLILLASLSLTSGKILAEAVSSVIPQEEKYNQQIWQILDAIESELTKIDSKTALQVYCNRNNWDDWDRARLQVVKAIRNIKAGRGLPDLLSYQVRAAQKTIEITGRQFKVIITYQNPLTHNSAGSIKWSNGTYEVFYNQVDRAITYLARNVVLGNVVNSLDTHIKVLLPLPIATWQMDVSPDAQYVCDKEFSMAPMILSESTTSK